MKGSLKLTSFMSLKAFVKNLAYNRCITACSAPPMYLSTGMNCLIFNLSKISLLFLLSMYLKKYQLESKKVSIVSVSLFAFPLHLGHFILWNFSLFARGFPWPVNLTSSGRITGISLLTIPHLSQYIIGMGVPQYLCLEISQSLNL